MTFLYSLRLRLLLMFMLVALAAMGISQVFTRATINTAFELYVSRIHTDLPTIPDDKNMAIVVASTNRLSELLLQSYKQNGASQALQAQIVSFGKKYQIHIVLIDSANHVIADSALPGSQQPPVAPKTSYSFASVTGMPTIVISTSMSIPPASPPQTGLPTPEATFFDATQRALWLAILLAALVCLFLSIACSNMIIKPIRALTLVANRMEQGDLSQRVHIGTRSEIGSLAHAFNTMADGLEKLEQLRRNMVSDVAHELRTPLTNIRGYLEALQDQVITPTSEIIASLYEEALLLTRLVTDLQELSLVESGRLSLVHKSISLEDLIIKALHAFQPQAESKKLTLNLDIPAHLPQVKADPERVGQILRNLLNNAIMHTPPGGEITVKAWKDLFSPHELHISVKDTGEGIEAKHLPYIFERFYRADASRTRATGGTGLGLAIVKQMVQAHGGHVKVESCPGYGSCFTFTLPLVSLAQPD